MSRTPLAPHLLRNPASASSDAMRFDALAAMMLSVALDHVRIALHAEGQSTAADAWLDEGRHALRFVLQDADVLSDDHVAGTRKALADALEGSVPPPDELEVREHSEELARTMVSSWTQFLRATVEASRKAIVLGDEMLPRPTSQASQEFWQRLRSSLNGYAVGPDEAPHIMREFAVRLRQSHGDSIPLPFGLIIECRTGLPAGGVAVVRKGDVP